MPKHTRTLLAAAAVGLIWAGRKYLRARRAVSFQGKVVVITGGARGLGLAIARALASEGAVLAICSRTEADLHTAAIELRALGARVLTSVCDVTDPDSCHQFLSQVRQELGEVDILINNAGVITAGPYNVLSREDFAQSLDTHFWGAYNTIMACLPSMRERAVLGTQPRIVNISSIGGKVSVPHLLPYTTGKFALTGISEGLRAELAPDGILVTTVCPGLLQTGSHIQVTVKGNHAKEYALFKTLDALPVLSMDAGKAATRIVEGIRFGQAEVIIGVAAQALALFQGIAPDLNAELLGLAAGFLPKAGPGGTVEKKGYQLEGPSSAPAAVNTLLDSKEVAYNQKP
jgi:NAD(P)-dependent dehydrogenase (short-subunit alcohol dehydrogenase family)